MRKPPWWGLGTIQRVTNKGESGFGKASDRVTAKGPLNRLNHRTILNSPCRISTKVRMKPTHNPKLCPNVALITTTQHQKSKRQKQVPGVRGGVQCEP